MEEIRTNEEMMENEAEIVEFEPETEFDEETGDHDFAKGLGIGALLGAAVLYGGSKIVKKVKNRKRKKNVVSFIDKVKERVKKTDDEDFDDLFEEDLEVEDVKTEAVGDK